MNSLISQNDPLAPLILGLTLVLSCALLGRIAARKLRQPTMVGELLMGILLGNILFFSGYDLIGILREGVSCLEMTKLTLAGQTWEQAANQVFGEEAGRAFLGMLRGPEGSQYLQISQAVDVFFRYAVIFLMFHLGLGAGITKMRQVSTDSWRVAVVGVLVPFILGYLVIWLFVPGASQTQHIFLSATLVATSIGVTGNILDKLNQLDSKEAKTILNAAVIDDVLGLILLTIGTGIALSGSISVAETARISLLAGLFLVTALLAGPYFLRFISWFLRRMDILEAKLFISFVFVMVLAGLANLMGVLSFVAAFAAGLLMIDSQNIRLGSKDGNDASLKDLLAPIEVVLVPVFFVLMGIQIKLELFVEWQTIGMLLVLLFAALAGKLISGLASGDGNRKLCIGIGMMARGEVGLVFAAIGKSAGVIDDTMFAVLIILVIISTLVTPPLFKLARDRKGREGKGGAD